MPARPSCGTARRRRYFLSHTGAERSRELWRRRRGGFAMNSPCWTTAIIHQARWPFAVAVAGSKAIFVGSGTSGVDVYDSATDHWSATAGGLSQERYQVRAASVGREALFAGGCTDPQQSDFSRISDVVDIYDSATDHWRSATLSQARIDMGVTTVGSKVLFAGGFTRPKEGSYSAAVDIYDSVTGAWSTAALSHARASRVAATAGTKALFTAGWGSPA